MRNSDKQYLEHLEQEMNLGRVHPAQFAREKAMLEADDKATPAPAAPAPRPAATVPPPTR